MMDWMSRLTLGQLAEHWKKTLAAVVAAVTLVTGLLAGWRALDGRWVKTEVYASEMQQLRGQVNFQVNELKREAAKNRLKQAEAKLAEFRTRPAAERFAPSGAEYQAFLEREVRDARDDVRRLDAALQNDAGKVGR
jgi:predicted negative regulator of RcsB-dependent stress response